MENQDKLKEVPLFSSLNEQELSEIKKIAVENTFLRNAIIIQKEDTSTSLYVVLSGKAVAIGSNEDGRQIILNVFKKGDCFGEMSFIDSAPRSATVQTTEKTRIMTINGDKLRSIFLSNSEMMLKLMKELLRKIRVLTEQLTGLAFENVYKRVVLLLMRLAKPQGDKWIIEEKLTHKEIAEMVFASREMVSRIMSELSDGEYITVCKDSVIINKKFPEKW